MQATADEPDQKEAAKPKAESVFWDRQEGLYLTFKRDEVGCSPILIPS